MVDLTFKIFATIVYFSLSFSGVYACYLYNMEAMTIKDYLKLVDDFYNKPPRDAGDKRLKLLSKHRPYDFVNLYDGKLVASGVVLRFQPEGIYGICGITVDKDKQKQGWGTHLMNKIHRLYKGIFILASRNAEEFYIKLGYRKFGDVLIYVNKNIVDW